MSYKIIETARFRWSWKEFGTGPRLLLAFHGFNRSPDDFHSFEKWLGTEYRILAFDLFFHGKSIIKSDEPLPSFTGDELKKVIEEILEIYSTSVFEVMAHSFGGRLALNCVELFEERVKGVYLMAPDAMRFNPGYWFGTQTTLGRMIMRRYKKDPEPVLRFMRLLPRLGLYNQKAIEFYINQVTFPPMREKVFKVWMSHRYTGISRKRVSNIIKKHQIPVLLFFGRYDSVIPPVLGENFAKLSGSSAALHIIDTGHRLPEKHYEISEIILNNGPVKQAQKNRPDGDQGG